MQRLVASGDPKQATEVLLFCRLAGSPNGPYVCCGRLDYVSHVKGYQPLKFVWRLRDAAELRGQEAFEELLATAE